MQHVDRANGTEDIFHDPDIEPDTADLQYRWCDRCGSALSVTRGESTSCPGSVVADTGDLVSCPGCR